MIRWFKSMYRRLRWWRWARKISRVSAKVRRETQQIRALCEQWAQYEKNEKKGPQA